MHLLTDGLKLAAGRALEDMLERSTSTRLRGLAAGVLITSLVQSSTAVTLASIGFVNTGLLSLQNGLWVIFGSNVGSTMNAWLVAALGFGFKIDAFALPFVGTGAILMVATRAVRGRALGQALAGFGLLFIGIGVLQDTFSAFGRGFDLAALAIPGVTGYLLLVGLGTVLTLLMQASGAVIALVITAAQTGLVPIETACAIAIGTNIGTTFTAILAAIGATPNAKRLAASHVFFNLIASAVALMLLPLLIAFVERIGGWFGGTPTPAVMIALFHTTVNVLGVLLMVPLADWLLRVLSARFGGDENETRPQYLDANAVAVPDLAVRALRRELGRTQQYACAALACAAAQPADTTGVQTARTRLETLAEAIDRYSGRITSLSLPLALGERLARSLRVLQYQQTGTDYGRHAAELGGLLGPLADEELAAAALAFTTATAELARQAETDTEGFRAAALEEQLLRVESDYARLKENLLAAGAHARLNIHEMQERLRQASLLRRAAEQAAKAARHLAALDCGAMEPQDGGAQAAELADVA
ncbi:Na/Pi cotransporter family protein [Azoarcus sp. TTM-91]|nr:Na/Pi cotransporter family protein [Azoarcus sp. TTM-91]